MARRVETWLVGSAGWLVASALTGCYTHHTADEELINLPFPADAHGDAGDAGGAAHAADAAAARDAGTCTGANAIETFICGLSPQTGGTTGTTGTTGTPGGINLTDLITLFGGGTGTNTGTTGTAGQPSIADIIALFGGGTGTTPGAGTTPVRRDAGVGMTRPGGQTTMPTAAECAAATDQFTKFLCMMQQQGRGTMNQGMGNTRPAAMTPPPPAATEDAAVQVPPAVVEDAGVPPTMPL